MLTPVLVDTTELVTELIDTLFDPSSTPIKRAAVDLEGVDLCRFGTISLMQIYPQGGSKVYIVDVTVLGTLAFNTPNAAGQTLKKDLLESEEFTKIFFDVRNDSDALYHHFGINLVGCSDLQVLELCKRRSRNEAFTFVNGLSRAMSQNDVGGDEWNTVKEKGIRLYSPNYGGSFQVFETRPLDKALIDYCAQDVSLLFELESALKGKIAAKSRGSSFGIARAEIVVAGETKSRIRLSQSAGYVPNGRHKAIANVPWYEY